MTKSHLTPVLAALLLLAIASSCCLRKHMARYAKDYDTLTADTDSLQESDTLLAAATAAARPLTLKHLHVDARRIMPYVTCPMATVNHLLAIADTVYSRTDSYRLEDIDMLNDDYNGILYKSYGDSLHILVALYMSYEKLRAAGHDEPNAVFAWHEVAKRQMDRFMKDKGYRSGHHKGYENILLMADSLQSLYGCGTQPELNLTAWSTCMPAEFHLIDSYKQLIDICGDPEVKRLVHKDHKYTLDTHRKYCEKLAADGWWSAQEMDFASYYSWIMEKKKKNIDFLVRTCRNDSVNLPLVKKNLREHRCIIGRNRSIRLTTSLFDMDNLWNL